MHIISRFFSSIIQFIIISFLLFFLVNFHSAIMMLLGFTLNPIYVVELVGVTLYKYKLFLIPVITISIIAILLMHRYCKKRFLYKWYIPALATIVFWVSFVVVGDVYKTLLMFVSAERKDAQCIHMHSLVRSMHTLGDAPEGFSYQHGNMIKDQRGYSWSYEKMNFIRKDRDTPEGCGKHDLSLQ